MKSITWQLVLGAGTGSRIIAWWGAGGYSHIDVESPAGYLRGARSDKIGHVLPGYRDRPQNYETWAKVTRYTLEISDEQYQLYWDFSNRHVGDPYDERGLFAAFLLGHKHDLQDPRDKWVGWCSQEVALNGQYAHLWSLSPEKTNIEPGDCAMLLEGARARREDVK